MEELYDESVFERELPIWFVVAKAFAERNPETGRLRLSGPEAGAFCGGQVDQFRCIAAFTDEDLAERHSKQYPDTVAVGVADIEELIELLSAFYPEHFESIIFDPGSSKWTKNRKSIPEFIASLSK